MKLYYFADGCSLAAHICLREAGLSFDTIRVDPGTRLTADGRNYADVNAKGYVPALALNDGTMLTENVAILDWIGQRSDGLRPVEEMARTRLIEWLAFMTTEMHRPFLFLFFMSGEDFRPAITGMIESRFAHAAGNLNGDWLLGNRFSPADAFLYVMLRWARMSQIKVPAKLNAFSERVEARPSVRATLAAEGIPTLQPA